MSLSLATKITKRKIQMILGALWLLDGLLQLQHQMFSANFANKVLAPTANGQPLIVRGPVHFAVHTILLHPAIFDSCFALIQLTIGALLLWKRTVRYGLIGSTIWGLLVWYFGEGMGGLLGGQATLLTGAPGAALIYAVLALALWPATKDEKQKTPANWLTIFWAILWLGGAVLQMLPNNSQAMNVAMTIQGNAQGAPGWLASIDTHIASIVQHAGNWIVAVLVGIEASIGFLVFLPRFWRRLGIALGIIVSMLFWFVGQSLGTYYSGLATDPNSAPLIVLLGIAILGTSEAFSLRNWI